MKISRHREPSGLVVTRFGGRHTYEDANAALLELREMTGESPSVYEIVVHDDDLTIDLSRAEVEALKSDVISTFSSYQRGGLAFVANVDVVFGLCRQLEFMMENARIAISVFRSEELARQWIEEIRSIEIP